MIIHYDKPGQLSNRIWSVLPSIAYGLEHKEKVLLINFDEYLDPFENLNKNNLIHFASRKLLRKFFFSLKVRGYIQNGRSNIFRKYLNLNLIEGWSNRLGNQQMIVNQSNIIRDIFQFKKSTTKEVDQLFDDFTNDYTLVGVHIRRGDYREWLNGKYYYSDAEYLSILIDIDKQLKLKGQKAKFLLCSNEKLNIHNFSDLDYFIIENSSGVKDLYALSRCSYMIGPPSSYSQWASFIGKVPLKFIMNKDDKIALLDFSIIVSFNKFDNGNELFID
ncbi:MAG: alpha-1,2-fucosyltransferase [Prevotella sp.]|jgi:hypothetical protein|nr:alpha-1,2-fucosyltransferase [Prevotella sp.]